MLLVVGLVLAGVAVVAASIGALNESGRISEEATDAPAAADGSAATTRPSPFASTPDASPRAGTAPLAIVSVDLHRIGPPDPEELPITQVVGSVEVVAFPTAFDRSLRLAGTAAGLCVQLLMPSQEAASSTAFDLHLGEAETGGRLIVMMSRAPTVPAIGLVLELAAFAGLDREAWYRVVVTGEEEGGRLEVTPVGDDRRVLDADLALDPTVAPASSEETCIHASLGSADAAVFLDNLQVDR